MRNLENLNLKKNRRKFCFMVFTHRRNIYKYLTMMVLLMVTSIISCKTPEVSITDQKYRAEKAIESAESVNADDYAPEEFDLAISSYETGNDYVSQKNNVEAYTNYSLAINYANDAYKKSIGLYVGDLIDETDEMIADAKRTLKNVSLFEKTVDINEEAKLYYENEDFLEAKEKTLAARDSIELAYRHVEVDTDNIRALREGEEYYRVKYNVDDRDCLWKIADRELGNPLLWEKIYDRNNDIINDPDLIYPDQSLILPNINSLN